MSGDNQTKVMDNGKAAGVSASAGIENIPPPSGAMLAREHLTKRTKPPLQRSESLGLMVMRRAGISDHEAVKKRTPYLGDSGRKHSSEDLKSRLKTRKVLGVGEIDNGDVHKSKISQILGHSEHLYSKLPRGLWHWQISEAFSYALLSLLALCFPSKVYSVTLGLEMTSVESALGVRFYGAALVCVALLMWNVIGSTDKPLLRLSIVISCVHYGIQIVGIIITMVHLGHYCSNPLPFTVCRIVQIIIGRIYYRGLMKVYKSTVINPEAGIRKSESFGNLADLRHRFSMQNDKKVL